MKQLAREKILTSWFWYAVTPMKFVSGKVKVFISSDLRLITEAVWSRLRIICTRGWYLCIELRMSCNVQKQGKSLNVPYWTKIVGQFEVRRAVCKLEWCPRLRRILSFLWPQKLIIFQLDVNFLQVLWVFGSWSTMNAQELIFRCCTNRSLWAVLKLCALEERQIVYKVVWI